MRSLLWYCCVLAFGPRLNCGQCVLSAALSFLQRCFRSLLDCSYGWIHLWASVAPFQIVARWLTFRYSIIYSGPLNDRFMLAKTRRNRGYREPEFLLWCAVPTAFIMSAGLMLYGIASARGLPWIVPFVGAGLVGFGLAVGGEISIAYTIDCYTLLDTQAVTTVILIRNVIGFAITWAIQPWIETMGQQNAFILVGALSFFISIFAVVMIIFGKRWRKWTQPRYEKLALERA